MKRIQIIKNISKGFTLIELLIVIAVLGILAAVVLVAIDPVQQLARGRDSGRKTSIGQLGRALQAYYTTQSAYPAGTDWTANILVTSGEIRTFPSNAPYSGGGAACITNIYPATNGYCYNINVTPDTVIYARMESGSENNKCGVGGTAWFVYSTADGRAGIVCGAGEPGPGPQIFVQ